MRLLSALLLAPMAALALSFAGLVAWPADLPARLVWSGLAVFALWPAFMFYSYWPERAWPAAAVPVATILLSLPVILFV